MILKKTDKEGGNNMNRFADMDSHEKNTNPENTAEPGRQKQGRIHVCHGDTILSFGSPTFFTYRLKDAAGIHARPAAALYKLSKQFKSEIIFSTGEKSVKADSLIHIMSLGAKQGTCLKVEAHGEDAKEALAAFGDYFEKNL